jgi:phage tail-like protein
MSEYRAVSDVAELPFLTYRFTLALDGLQPKFFNEVSGLGYSLEVVTKEVSGDVHSLRKTAGPIDYDEIQLTRPLSSDMELYEWFQQTVDGTVERKNGAVTLLDENGSPVAEWGFQQAWPMKYAISDLDAGDGSVVTESITLTHEMLERTQ